MSEKAVFAGPVIRRLRKREGLTQAAMAARLEISSSYLNLIERNQRPLSARVMMMIVDRFDFDPRRFREDDSLGGVDGVARRLADERFADLDIDREEIVELLSGTPNIASAFARLYDAAGQTSAENDNPLDQSRREIERWGNHFADLDEKAEILADELRLSRGDMGVALADRLREVHQFSVRILPRDVMPDALRRLDLHARQLQLSEMLTPASRNFQIAVQISQLEAGDDINAIARGANFADDAPRNLFERHLHGYFAAALLMPYSRFLRACEATDYDLHVLERRFGVSFEQLAHRLTTLQRVGQRGLPFFMARIDRAGQFSKRFAGASGATLLESDASCPLWNVHRGFERQGEFVVGSIEVDAAGAGGAHWVTIARSVEASGTAQEGEFVVILGLEQRHAASLAQLRGISPEALNVVPTGMGCARCMRQTCKQRSLPPRGARLIFDRMSHGTTPFVFDDVLKAD